MCSMLGQAKITAKQNNCLVRQTRFVRVSAIPLGEILYLPVWSLIVMNPTLRVFLWELTVSICYQWCISAHSEYTLPRTMIDNVNNRVGYKSSRSFVRTAFSRSASVLITSSMRSILPAVVVWLSLCKAKISSIIPDWFADAYCAAISSNNLSMIREELGCWAAH